MRTLVETASGEIVEIVAGVLTCQNDKKNWLTIADWMLAQSETHATITAASDVLHIEFPFAPTHVVESLLEHFEYQK